MKLPDALRKESLWASIVVIAAALLVFSRTINHLLIGDELRYCYKFDLKPGDNYFNFNDLEPVESISDVVESQINHYFCVNGRIPVHFIEQTVSAYNAYKPFYVVNVVMLAVAMLLFMRVALPRRRRELLVPALVTAICFLYMFPTPARLWTSINLSLNYLWPLTATLGVLALLSEADSGRLRHSTAINIGLAVLGLLTGWSNEAFSFPLSGALGIYYLLNIKKFTAQVRWLVIPLWIGAIIMLASPGNWIRAAQASTLVSSYIDVLLQLKLLWLAIAALIAGMALKRRPTLAFIKANYVFVTMLCLALCIGVVAHTAVRAFTAIELFAGVLLMRAAAPLFVPAGRKTAIACALIFALLAVHQGLAAMEHRRHYEAIKQAVEDYATSPTGTVRYDYSPSPAWLAPWAYAQVPTANGADYEWRLLGISRCGTRKRFTALSAAQYSAIDSLNIPAEKDEIYPFTKIDGAVFAPADAITATKYRITSADGRSAIAARRLFTTPGGRVAATIIPPGENFEITSIKPITKSK